MVQESRKQPRRFAALSWRCLAVACLLLVADGTENQAWAPMAAPKQSEVEPPQDTLEGELPLAQGEEGSSASTVEAPQPPAAVVVPDPEPPPEGIDGQLDAQEGSAPSDETTTAAPFEDATASEADETAEPPLQPAEPSIEPLEYPADPTPAVLGPSSKPLVVERTTLPELQAAYVKAKVQEYEHMTNMMGYREYAFESQKLAGHVILVLVVLVVVSGLAFSGFQLYRATAKSGMTTDTNLEISAKSVRVTSSVVGIVVLVISVVFLWLFITEIYRVSVVDLGVSQ